MIQLSGRLGDAAKMFGDMTAKDYRDGRGCDCTGCVGSAARHQSFTQAAGLQWHLPASGSKLYVHMLTRPV